MIKTEALQTSEGGFKIISSYDGTIFMDQTFKSKSEANSEFILAKYYFLRTELDKVCKSLAYGDSPILGYQAAQELKAWHDNIYKLYGMQDYRMKRFCTLMTESLIENVHRLYVSHPLFQTYRSKWEQLNELALSVIADINTYEKNLAN